MSILKLPPLERFASYCSPALVKSLQLENLSGAEMIDNLILLDIVALDDIREVLETDCKIKFGTLIVDPTPVQYRDIADRHHVMIQHSTVNIVYVPLGCNLDSATLSIDLPDAPIQYIYIADCVYRSVSKGIPLQPVSNLLGNVHPLLALRRLLLQCIDFGATDFHVVYYYVDKAPQHVLQYRSDQELHDMPIQLNDDLTRRMISEMVSKLSKASVADLDSDEGVETSVADVFGDGGVELRVSARRVAAGYYCVVTIQTLKTTTLKIGELGFPEQDSKLIEDLANRRTGLTLITGKPRSGKNTTIYAMANEFDTKRIRVIEYANPIENRMAFPQVDYHGNIPLLLRLVQMAKKQDLDIALLNELPNRDVAFAVRDLVNSAIYVITTTHLNRVWHLPGKLEEFFAADYKTLITQLNAVVNQRMFLRWSGPNMHKRILDKSAGDFEMFAYQSGVRQYFVPEDISKVTFSCQPLVEILLLDDQLKSALLNFDELYRAEETIRLRMQRDHNALENRVADYINSGYFSLDELKKLR